MKIYVHASSDIVDYRGYEFHKEYDGTYIIFQQGRRIDDGLSLADCYDYVDNKLDISDQDDELLERQYRMNELWFDETIKHTFHYQGPAWYAGEEYFIDTDLHAETRSKALHNLYGYIARYVLHKNPSSVYDDIIVDNKLLKKMD